MTSSTPVSPPPAEPTTQRPAHPQTPAGAAPLTARDVVQFIHRYGLAIALAALVAGIGTALVVSSLLPPSFRASATLMVVPPTFTSELKPPTMSVQGYRTLLESDAVVAKLTRKLQQEGLLDSSDVLRIGQELKSRIFVSRRAEENALAPMIEAVSIYDDPDKASRIANAWSAVFLEHTQELMAKATTPTADFVESQYAEANSSLEDLETEQVQTASDLDQKLNNATVRWERKISSFRRDFEDRFATFQKETRTLFQEKGQELEPPQSGPGNPTGTDGTLFVKVEVDSESKSLLRRILVVREQLAQTPERLRLEKSISDDALWDALAGRAQEGASSTSASGTLLGQTLQSEEINPTYTELALRATELEIELGGVHDQNEDAVEAYLSELKDLERQRRTLLNKLFEERRSELEVLLGQRQVELDGISRMNAARLAQLDREVSSRRKLVGELANNRNEARIARAQEDLADIRLGAAAVAPSRPESKGVIAKALVAAFLATVVALSVALFRELATP